MIQNKFNIVEYVLSHNTWTNEVWVTERKTKEYGMKGKKNPFKLGGLSYQGFELSKGRLTVNVQNKSREGQFWFELVWALEGLTYW